MLELRILDDSFDGWMLEVYNRLTMLNDVGLVSDME